jgi:hypothetical protein
MGEQHSARRRAGLPILVPSVRPVGAAGDSHVSREGAAAPRNRWATALHGRRRVWRSVRREEGIRLVAVGHGSNMESRVSDRGADRIQGCQRRNAPNEIASQRLAQFV